MTCTRQSPTGVWSSSDPLAVKLISYWAVHICYPTTLDSYMIISRSVRPLLDKYPITSWLLFERWPTRYWTFLTVKNYRVGSLIDADHPDHLPDRFLIAWSGLMRSAVWTQLYCRECRRWRSCGFSWRSRHVNFTSSFQSTRNWTPTVVSWSRRNVFLRWGLTPWKIYHPATTTTL